MPFRPGSEACGSVFCRQWPENIVPDGELVGAKFGRLPEKSLSLPIRGEVLEWLKRRAWKARIRLKRIRGSNPLLSANDREVGWVANDIRLQPFLFSGWDKFVRSGLKIKVGRMVGRRKSGVLKAASGPTEGRTGGMW